MHLIGEQRQLCVRDPPFSSPMALVARRPLQWLARFGKSANSAHAESVDAAIATLHPNVTFRHEDHSRCPADSRPDPRPHHRPSRSSPTIHGPDSRHERAVSASRRSAAEPRPAGSRTPLCRPRHRPMPANLSAHSCTRAFPRRQMTFSGCCSRLIGRMICRCWQRNDLDYLRSMRFCHRVIKLERRPHI